MSLYDKIFQSLSKQEYDSLSLFYSRFRHVKQLMKENSQILKEFDAFLKCFIKLQSEKTLTINYIDTIQNIYNVNNQGQLQLKEKYKNLIKLISNLFCSLLRLCEVFKKHSNETKLKEFKTKQNIPITFTIKLNNDKRKFYTFQTSEILVYVNKDINYLNQKDYYKLYGLHNNLKKQFLKQKFMLRDELRISIYLFNAQYKGIQICQQYLQDNQNIVINYLQMSQFIETFQYVIRAQKKSKQLKNFRLQEYIMDGFKKFYYMGKLHHKIRI
ncbi:hypothetical protein pb186bvf_003684 [Paramecium bursaria]